MFHMDAAETIVRGRFNEHIFHRHGNTQTSAHLHERKLQIVQNSLRKWQSKLLRRSAQNSQRLQQKHQLTVQIWQRKLGLCLLVQVGLSFSQRRLHVVRVRRGIITSHRVLLTFTTKTKQAAAAAANLTK